MRHKRRGKSNREIAFEMESAFQRSRGYGLTGLEPRKKRRRKQYIRYEREHSISAGHIDWFEKDRIKFCAILDDASRKILVAGEFENANTDNSIALVDKLVEDYWGIMPMKELISDVTLNPWV